MVSDSKVEETAQAEKVCLYAARQEVAERKVVENLEDLGKEFVNNDSRVRYGNLRKTSEDIPRRSWLSRLVPSKVAPIGDTQAFRIVGSSRRRRSCR